MKIADTHTHFYFPDFDGKRDETHNLDKIAGVEFQIQIGADEISSRAAIALTKRFSDFYATIGIHPDDIPFVGNPSEYRISGFKNFTNTAQTIDELFETFETLFLENRDKIVGFGETGFDFAQEKNELIYGKQKDVFSRHLVLAKKFNKTLVIHSRNARTETLDFFNEQLTQEKVLGVVHCFCEDLEFAKLATEKYGLFLGVGGILTYKNSDKIREAIAKTPIEFLVTETDAPFLTPFNFRKKNALNNSRFIVEVLEKIAEIKGMPVDEVAEILFENAKRCFQL
jgi:TatD DNase family protein